MPQAEPTFTRPPGKGVTLLITVGGDDDVVHPLPTRIDDALLRSCDAARASGAARAALMASVAELNPTDPKHEAAYEAAAHLRPAWERHIHQVCCRPACTVAGLVAKARLAMGLFERDQDEAVIGGPGLRVAASLASDLLVLDAADP